MNELKKLVINGTEYAVTDDTKIPVPAGCRVGQTVVVKAVDDAGSPTAWKTADIPRIAVITGLYLENARCAILEYGGQPMSAEELAVLLENQPALVHFAYQWDPDLEETHSYTMVATSWQDSAILHCLGGGWTFEPSSNYVTYGGKQYQVWGYA